MALPVVVPDPPTLMICDWPVECRHENSSPEWNDTDSARICGDPDFEHLSTPATMPSIGVSTNEVVVYDILRSVLYKGSYKVFTGNASRYRVTE